MNVMKFKRLTLAALAVTTTLAFGISAKPAAADIASGQKAVIISPQSSNDFSTNSFDQSVSNAVNDGANYIYLIIPVSQANIYSTSIYDSYNTPTDQSLAAATSYIHGLGAKVAFSLHDDSQDGQWRANINPSDRNSWFASYSSMLNHFGSDAQQDGANEIVIGTEMYHMTNPGVDATNTANWETMIASLRGIYSGKLTYSAQHDQYDGELNTLGFWSKLDYIGVSAYYSLGTDDSVSALMQSWANIDSSYVSQVANRYGKQVVFTEVGYQSKSGATYNPGASYQNGGGVDLTLQANAYQALLQYWNSRSYFGGVAFWGWSSNPGAGGSNDSDYTPQNKPAEQTMKQWFTTNNQGGGGGPVAATSYAVKATNTPTLTSGTNASLSYQATANQTVSNAIVDLEIYNANGQQVYQSYLSGQTVTASGLNFSVNWTPATAGTYTVKAGVFTANWAQNLYWNNNVTSLTVGSASTPTPPTPPVTPPTPPVTPPTPPVTPPTPPTNPTSANISIWWPGNGVSVGGVQPFKALVDGLDTSQYNMYWQVDGGGLNLMGNNTNPINHKEVAVDLSGWNWQPSNNYTITFVAKDLNGNVIATKSTTITVTH